MQIDKTDAQKHREVQDKPSYRKNCSLCVRSFYDSLVGPCPLRDGRQVCMYCCRMCGHHYRGEMGQGCRVKDAARKKGKKPAAAGVPHQSPAAAADRAPTAARRVPSREDAPSGRESGDGKGDAA